MRKFQTTHYRWNFPDKMKTGVSNNNNNNKHYSDKFQVIESISERNNNNSSPSIDVLSYSNISNNNVYADIADLDGTETHSLMYSQNVSQPPQQWGRHDRTLSSSSRRQLDDQSFYVSNSTPRSVHSSYGKIENHFVLFYDFFLLSFIFLLWWETFFFLCSNVREPSRYPHLITQNEFLFCARNFTISLFNFILFPLQHPSLRAPRWYADDNSKISRLCRARSERRRMENGERGRKWAKIVTLSEFVIQFHASCLQSFISSHWSRKK